MKKILVCLLGSALLIFAGCMDYDETLNLKKDGSGTVNVRYAIDKAYLDQIKMISELMSQDTGKDSAEVSIEDLMFSKSDIENDPALIDAGIKLESYDVSEDEISRIWQMGFSFTDINKIDALADALSSGEEEFAPPIEPGEIFFDRGDGTWEYSQPFMEPDEEYEDEGAEYPEMLDEEMGDESYDADTDMEGMGSDMTREMEKRVENRRVKITINFPGEIVETNATSTAGNTAVWEYKITELNQAPERLTAIIKN